MQDDKLLTTKEVADELRVSERTIINWITKGELAAIDLPKGYRIYRSELDRYIRERQTKKE